MRAYWTSQPEDGLNVDSCREYAALVKNNPYGITAVKCQADAYPQQYDPQYREPGHEPNGRNLTRKDLERIARGFTNLREALGDKRGIRRFGDATVLLDEALVQAVVDVSGRPYCVHTGEPEGQQYVRLGGDGVAYLGSLTQHVFETIAFHAHLAMHVRVLAGREPHHIVETQFKAFARAFRDAIALDPREGVVPFTKGAL